MSGKVIDIGQARIRTKSKWARKYDDRSCGHHKITLDEYGYVLRCDECGDQLNAFWWLHDRLPEVQEYYERLRERRESLDAHIQKTLHLTAARDLEKRWRSRTSVPACPHCREAILPEDDFQTVYQPPKKVREARASTRKSGVRRRRDADEA